MSDLKDGDVRALLRDFLDQTHAGEEDAFLLEEVGIREGRARADLAVLNGDLHGLEIKSGRDSLTRLRTQVEYYSQVFHRCTAVVDSAHTEDVDWILPDWWGLAVVRMNEGAPQLTTRREAGANPNHEPRALVELLWREEALEILKRRGLASGLLSKPRSELWDALAKHLSSDEIRFEVCKTLKNRDGWKSDRRRQLGDV